MGKLISERGSSRLSADTNSKLPRNAVAFNVGDSTLINLGSRRLIPEFGTERHGGRRRLLRSGWTSLGHFDPGSPTERDATPPNGPVLSRGAPGAHFSVCGSADHCYARRARRPPPGQTGKLSRHTFDHIVR